MWNYLIQSIENKTAYSYDSSIFGKYISDFQKSLKEINSDIKKTDLKLNNVILKAVFRENNFFTTDLTLVYNNVQGELIHSGDKIPFILNSIIFGTGILPDSMSICENKITLHTNIPYHDVNGIEIYSLSYIGKQGEICDASGNSLKEFYGLRLEDIEKYSPFIDICKRSNVYKFNGKLRDGNYPDLKENEFTDIIFDTYYCKAPDEFHDIKDENLIVYYKFDFLCTTDTNLNIRFSHSGDAKVWINKEEFIYQDAEELTFHAEELEKKFDFVKGENEVLVAVTSNHGCSRGFSLRFEKTPKSKFPQYCLRKHE